MPVASWREPPTSEPRAPKRADAAVDVDQVVGELIRSAVRGWLPEPDLTVSQWAARHRQLGDISGPEAGQWRNARTPYLVEIMDLLSANDPTTELCFMKGGQIGGTEAGLNFIGYVIHHAPGPMLMVQPTLEMLKKVSKQKLAPAIEATPELAERVRSPRTRDSGNTLVTKEFPGGILLMTTAGSSAGLRSMSVRYLFCDEVDEYEGDVGNQGDPIELAKVRTQNFRTRKKCFYVSTPKNKGSSRIEGLYLASDQRRYFIPCPECGHMDFLTWSGFADFLAQKDAGHHAIAWEEGQPETAHMVCGGCPAAIPEHRKTWMLEHGQWRARAPGPGRMPGFHLSGLYSPVGWLSWGDAATQFLKVKNDPSMFRVWVNTVLGEPWEERTGDRVDADTVLSRRESYPRGPEPDLEQRVPTGVGILLAAIDVQGDRLEWQVTGFGAGEESWLIAAGAAGRGAGEEALGDPTGEDVWRAVDQLLLEPFTHESGREMRVEAFAVDTGGHHTEQAYKFCRARFNRVPGRALAIRGGGLVGAPIAGTMTRTNAYRVPLWTLCVDSAKERIMSRLREVRAPGPGYIHLPEWVDEEYVAQLTAEKAVYKWTKGRRTREWVKMRDRNESLDCTVYCLAALHILGERVISSLGDRAARWAAPITPAAPAEPDHPQVRVPPALMPRPRRGGWASNWRR